MLTLHYSPATIEIGNWKDRLDKLVLKYALVAEKEQGPPYLLDGEKKVEGVSNIEAYLDGLEQFEKSWYEDRCDKYDFDPDAPIGLNV